MAKRWILTIEGMEYKPKIYAETAEKAKQVFSRENVIDVQPYIDMSYLNTIEYIKEKSKHLVIQTTKTNGSREWYETVLFDGRLWFKLLKDNTDDIYYDIAYYQFMSKDSLVYPVTFAVSNPQEVYDLFFTPPLTCEVASYRLYGQPKLQKPAELKGVKQSFTVDWSQNRCKCQCFIKDNDLWIKHRDFFSVPHRPKNEDIGTPLVYRAKKYFGKDLSYKNNFCYADCWGGDIILRNKAWIVFRNLKQAVKRDRHMPVRSMIQAFLNSDVLKQNRIYELEDNWGTFFENVCKEYTKTSSKGE